MDFYRLYVLQELGLKLTHSSRIEHFLNLTDLAVVIYPDPD